MQPSLRDAISTAIGSRVLESSRVLGGDVNDAFEVKLEDGRRVFVKSNGSADPLMFPAEARGLAMIADVDSLRTPRVLAVSPEQTRGPHFLVLEFIQTGSPRVTMEEELGRGLAMLHCVRMPRFGLDYENFIGPLPQSNRPHASWAEFYRWERLHKQLEIAVAAGRIDANLRRQFDKLLGRLDEFVGPPEPPTLLHGDLWSGNLLIDERGGPCVIDPAVYGGHREVDLAMMKLFGGFSSRVFAAYEEAYPSAPGHERRVLLHQLYPLMVHVNLFGGMYVASVRRALSAYV